MISPDPPSGNGKEGARPLDAEKIGPVFGELIPQQHGGALRRGGPGRPKNSTPRLRAKLRQISGQRLSVIEAAIDGRLTDPEGKPVTVSTADRIRAWEAAAKLGLGGGSGVPVPEVKAMLSATLDAISEIADGPTADRLLDRLREIWGGS